MTFNESLNFSEVWPPHCKMSMALRSAAQASVLLYQALAYTPGYTSEVDEVSALSLRGGHTQSTGE